MGKNYFPSRELELKAWAESFIGHVVATPTAFGTVAGTATALQTLITNWSALVDETLDPTTRTPGKISAKLAARRSMTAAIRSIVRTIQGYAPLTLEQRRDLGINLRDNPGTPINAPTTKPVMEILSADGRLFKMSIRAQGSAGKRAKEAGTQGAVVFTLVADQPTADMTQWEYQGQVSRGDFVLELPISVPAGAKVWFCSAWTSPRLQNGPPSTPISGYVGGAVNDVVTPVMPLAAPETPMLKAA